MGLHAGFHHVVLNLIFRSEYMYQVVTSATQQNFCTGGGGGGVATPPPPPAPSLRPEVPALILLYTIFDRKDQKGLTSGTPFTCLV